MELIRGGHEWLERILLVFSCLLLWKDFWRWEDVLCCFCCVPYDVLASAQFTRQLVDQRSRRGLLCSDCYLLGRFFVFQCEQLGWSVALGWDADSVSFVMRDELELKILDNFSELSRGT